MSTAGRCIARNTSSGIVVGPGIARNSRPARTAMNFSPSLSVTLPRAHGKSVRALHARDSFRCPEDRHKLQGLFAHIDESVLSKKFGDFVLYSARRQRPGQ